MKRRQRRAWAMTGLGAAGAALLVLWTPIGLLEMIVASLGLSEIVPAAAPPLGLTARALLASFAALMTAGIIAATRRGNENNDKESGRREGVPGAKTMGFAFSKLAALARGRIANDMGRDKDGMVPTLRRADAHPDAPARAPIFASRDFCGLDIFARTEPGRRQLVVNAEPEQDPVVADAGLEMPSAPAPLPETALPQPARARIQPGFTASAEPVAPAFDAAPEPAFPDVPPVPIAAVEPVSVPAPAPALSAPALSAPAPVPAAAQDQSITELTERLERGLALRRRSEPVASPDPAAATILAAIPPAQPVPVRPDVAPDVDDALRAALGNLRTMSGRAR